MRSFHRILALLTFFGWLSATGHVALEHQGMSNVSGVQYHTDEADGHHHDFPDHGDDHHDHDLNGIAAGQFTKTTELKVAAPTWIPLSESLLARLAAEMREAQKGDGVTEFEIEPEDERSSGWLMVIQTALPVRGPSLV